VCAAGDAGRWARRRTHDESEVYLYLLGVLPNLVAAVAIPFIVLGIWADQNLDASYSTAKRWFVGAAAVSGTGLIAWEFIQQTSRKLYFDPHDICASCHRIHRTTRRLSTAGQSSRRLCVRLKPARATNWKSHWQQLSSS